MGGARVWKNLVIGLVVGIHVVTDYRHRTVVGPAGYRRQGNIDHIIAETSSIGPSAGYGPALIIDGSISANKAQPVEFRLAGQAHGTGGCVHADDVRDVHGRQRLVKQGVAHAIDLDPPACLNGFVPIASQGELPAADSGVDPHAIGLTN